MPKGVAVPYIVALILGIVVIGLLGYWFLTVSSQTSGTGTSQICNAQKLAWCQQWTTTNFQGNCPPTQSCSSVDAADKDWQKFAAGCGNVAPKGPECPLILGQTTTTTS